MRKDHVHCQARKKRLLKIQGLMRYRLCIAGIRVQLELVDIPKGMKGVSLSLVIAGILAMAFMGFTGIVK